MLSAKTFLALNYTSLVPKTIWGTYISIFCYFALHSLIRLPYRIVQTLPASLLKPLESNVLYCLNRIQEYKEFLFNSI